MNEIQQALSVCLYNYRRWQWNPKIIITFLLTFILCFLLSDKVITSAEEYGTTLQMLEPFVWTFGDGKSILLISLLLVLLFSDMPFLTAATPYYLMRTRRKVWLAGQLLYLITASCIFFLFVLLSTMVLCARIAFPGNVWSKTAAILGYSGDGVRSGLPVLVKTLELSRPFSCTGQIFLLMILYALVLSLLMMALILLYGQRAGLVGAFGFSLYGILLLPSSVASLLQLPEELYYKANVLMGWLSPLNHATYSMHNFGYDRLPRLWQSYTLFLALILLLTAVCHRGIQKYNFEFTGTEGGR
ncbi:MAG: hypothetical protein MJ075_01145 [Oscillospiraceae bacterium]|nr:hypothetical protein [Oscillospiraceae bacterium]